jgi:hypothetical protein
MIPQRKTTIDKVDFNDFQLLFYQNRIALQQMNKFQHYGKKILISPLVLLINIYRWTISPWIGPKCRYTPSCSQYALDALRKYGLIKGSWKTIKRVSSCHPWGGSGYDPA